MNRGWMAIPAMLLVLVLTGALAASARAQDKKREAQLRTVHGTIVNKEENPVAASIVYLKNVKTQAVKTYIADEDGKYRFSGLDPNVDYELHAEKNDMTSATRAISSFDNRKDIPVFLKLDRKKNK